MPAVVVNQLQQKTLPIAQAPIDFSPIQRELQTTREVNVQQIDLIKRMVKHMQSMDSKEQVTPVWPGFVLKTDGGNTSLVDIRDRLKKAGVKFE
jgi:hypothetical protein